MFPSIPIQNYNILPSMLFHIGQLVSVELVSVNDNGYIGARIDGKYYVISDIIEATEYVTKKSAHNSQTSATQLLSLSKEDILKLINNGNTVKAAVLKTAPFILQLVADSMQFTSGGAQLTSATTTKMNIKTFTSLYTPNIQTISPYIDSALPKLTLLSFASPLPVSSGIPQIVYGISNHPLDSHSNNSLNVGNGKVYAHDNQRVKVSISALINEVRPSPSCVIIEVSKGSSGAAVTVDMVFSGARYSVLNYEERDIKLLQQSSANYTATLGISKGINNSISNDNGNGNGTVSTSSADSSTEQSNPPHAVRTDISVVVNSSSINNFTYNIVENAQISLIANNGVEINLPAKQIGDIARAVTLAVDFKSILPTALTAVSTLIIVQSGEGAPSGIPPSSELARSELARPELTTGAAKDTTTEVHNISASDIKIDEPNGHSTSKADVVAGSVDISQRGASQQTTSQQGAGNAPMDNTFIRDSATGRQDLAHQIASWQDMLKYIDLLNSHRVGDIYINFPGVSHKALPTKQFQDILIHLFLNAEVTVDDKVITISNIIAQVLSSTTVGIFTPDVLLNSAKSRVSSAEQSVSSSGNIYNINQGETSTNTPSKKITSLLHQLLKLDPFAISTIAASGINLTSAESLRQLILNGGLYYENKVKNSVDIAQDFKSITSTQPHSAQTTELTYLQLANILLNDSFTALLFDEELIEDGVIHIKREQFDWGVGVAVYIKMNFTAIGDAYVAVRPSGDFYNSEYLNRYSKNRYSNNHYVNNNHANKNNTSNNPSATANTKHMKYRATIMTELDISEFITNININNLKLKWKKLQSAKKRQLDDEIFNIDKRLISQLGQFDITI